MTFAILRCMSRPHFDTMKPKPPTQEPKSEPRIVVAKGHADQSRERDHNIPCTD